MNVFVALSFAVSLAGSATTTQPLADAKLVRGVSYTHSFVGSILTQPRQYMLQVEIKKGDPYGSIGAGTIDILSRPQLLLTNKQQGFFEVAQPLNVARDGEPPLTAYSSGMILRVVVESTGSNKVQLHGTTEITAVAATGANESSRRVEQVTFLRDVILGETVRVRMAKDGAKETWAEVTVKEPAILKSESPTAMRRVPVARAMPVAPPLPPAAMPTPRR